MIPLPCTAGRLSGTGALLVALPFHGADGIAAAAAIALLAQLRSQGTGPPSTQRGSPDRRTGDFHQRGQCRRSQHSGVVLGSATTRTVLSPRPTGVDSPPPESGAILNSQWPESPTLHHCTPLPPLPTAHGDGIREAHIRPRAFEESLSWQCHSSAWARGENPPIAEEACHSSTP